MPKGKDLKKLVRARMARTGESYSIARLHLVADAGPAPAPSPRSEKTAANRVPRAIYQVKVTIEEIEPPIWRRLHVSADMTLDQFHDVIQAAFGWCNYHLHEFLVDTLHFGVPDPEFADQIPATIDERNVRLRDVVRASKIVYEYDFGDSWQHSIEIESTSVAGEPGVRYPVCTGGERARPPEDCGGTSGYQDLLEILATPDHEEHRTMKTWVGRAFDPEKFDVRAVNRALRKVGGKSPRVAITAPPTNRPVV
jgi:hypothetical protein